MFKSWISSFKIDHLNVYALNLNTFIQKNHSVIPDLHLNTCVQNIILLFQEQQDTHVQPPNNQVSMVTQKKPLEVTDDDTDDIDLPTVPPPMKIQEHIFKASKDDSSEDLSKKVVSKIN